MARPAPKAVSTTTSEARRRVAAATSPIGRNSTASGDERIPRNTAIDRRAVSTRPRRSERKAKGTTSSAAHIVLEMLALVSQAAAGDATMTAHRASRHAADEIHDALVR